MSNNRDKSTKKRIEPIIGQEEFFGLKIFCVIDENIFPVFFEKWLSDELTKDKIIKSRSEETP
jgi:hypothetical protein